MFIILLTNIIFTFSYNIPIIGILAKPLQE